MRAINYLAGESVGCATVKKVALDSAFCDNNASCTVDGYNCAESVVNDGLDIKVVCANTQGDKVIYNTAGSS